MYKNIEEEKEYLKQTIFRFQEIISDTNLRLKAIPRMHSNNPTLLESLMAQYSRRLEMLQRTEKKPYFARIDFKNDKDNIPIECYIGKVGVSDDDNKLVTVDWRAPIASVYYDSNIGKASYLAPEGVITGDLLLKRQYDIVDGILNGFQDVDTVSNDEILKPYLGTSADNRLKNIVATIQSEQNEIIRQVLNNNMIIQGVAGSGKTTVALHRIAYLVYNHMKKINPDQYLVIGPNKFFVNYISGVLPDLDVDNVSQLTYDEILKNLIGEEFTLLSPEAKLKTSLNNPSSLAFEKIKLSMTYKRALDTYLSNVESTIIPKSNFSLKGYDIIPYEIIKNAFNSLNDSVIDYEVLSRKFDRIVLLLSKYIEDNYENIRTKIHEKFREKFSTLTKKEQEQERKNIAYIEKELRNNCNQTLKKYFFSKIPKLWALYTNFLKQIDTYLKIEGYSFEKEAKQTIKNLKTKTIEFEDIAGLLYIYYKMYGTGVFNKYRHTVIDEAQDFGDFNFYVLKKICSNSTFSIFGDLAQSIYQYRAIDNWDSVVDSVFDGKCEIKYLSKSYRTTTEIMESANNITKYLNLQVAQPVIRHGVDVNYTKFENNIISLINQFIFNYLNKGLKSIAIICKDEKEATYISNELTKLGINVNNITDSDTEYKGGICTITSYLSKGLEFDGVIIANASEEKYNSNRVIDMKLLYVAMTRALHELEVLYDNDISLPLQNELKKKETPILTRRK